MTVLHYLVAAAVGALLVVVVQWLARRRPASKWTQRDGFRRYKGLIVQDERGTTEIDEVLVTPAGVFVVEKKDFNAWIFGNKDDEYWTAVYPREKHRFQNPVRQNYRHLKALAAFLGISRSALSSLVVFSRYSRLMTTMPPEVVTSDHVALIRARDSVALTPQAFDAICARLDSLAVASDSTSLDRHVEELHARFDSTTKCPKCGGRLVQRRSRTPGDEANVFLGCSNFPTCRHIRNIDAT